ncbi:hypothetical protein HNR60_003180 [Rhodopseudomonas rhenobacensis]|uniref:Uncharacterized protein n=1 Tax=Rhodopseudomonas rhenobacensis TaxID=87461 RepID=A0A7W7Z5J2_9BRAD|nr:hypothetical protein [Rhodopseudomonas rhenobacensis]
MPSSPPDAAASIASRPAVVTIANAPRIRGGTTRNIILVGEGVKRGDGGVRRASGGSDRVTTSTIAWSARSKQTVIPGRESDSSSEPGILQHARRLHPQRDSGFARPAASRPGMTAGGGWVLCCAQCRKARRKARRTCRSTTVIAVMASKGEDLDAAGSDQSRTSTQLLSVMAGLVPATHGNRHGIAWERGWPGQSPAMTC